MLKTRFDKKVDDPLLAANNIIRDYDFIGITERMDESLVVLQMLLDLETADILYLTAKGHGRFDDGGNNSTCTYVVPSFVSPGMNDYFESREWTDRIVGDTHLYKAASISLDMTIDKLGRKAFGKQLAAFKEAKKIVDEKCQDTVVWPCSADGVFHRRPQGCLW